MLFVGITFSVIQIIKANPDAPNPGHSASEIECDTNLCIATTTSRVGIGSTSPGAKLQINPALGTEGLRIVTASNYSPLNIRNSSVDIFRIDQTGDMKVIKGIGYTWPSAQGAVGTVLTNNGAGILNWQTTGLPAGTMAGQTLRYDGTTWLASSVLLNDGTNKVTIGSAGQGKLTVGTIDPVYNVQGTKYATYISGMLGVKEETTGTIQLTNGEYIIDFNSLEEHSDLYIFYRITDFGENWSKLTILLSSEGPGGVWYKKDPQNNRLIIYSQTADSVSYRLSASRFDWQQWLNLSDDGDVQGLLVDEIVNNKYNQNQERIVSESGRTEGDFTQQIKEALSSIGLIVENGIAKVKEIIASRIKVDTAEVGQFQTIDKTTGQTYCIWLENGEWVKVQGECVQITDSNNLGE